MSRVSFGRDSKNIFLRLPSYWDVVCEERKTSDFLWFDRFDCYVLVLVQYQLDIAFIFLSIKIWFIPQCRSEFDVGLIVRLLLVDLIESILWKHELSKFLLLNRKQNFRVSLIRKKRSTKMRLLVLIGLFVALAFSQTATPAVANSKNYKKIFFFLFANIDPKRFFFFFSRFCHWFNKHFVLNYLLCQWMQFRSWK